MIFKSALLSRGQMGSRAWQVVGSRQWVVAFIFVVAIAAIRLPTINFSSLNYDEAVYTLIARGFRTGLIPYVDLVDRKPIGIFLFYDLAERIFHAGVIGPRILAALATLISCQGLYAYSRRFLGTEIAPAVIGGIFFSAFAVLFGGDAAQAPVFYMPFVVIAAYLVASNLERLTTQQTPSHIELGAAGLLLGIALQIKYSMLAECIGFGGILIAATVFHRKTLSPAAHRASIIGLALMVCGGLLPSVIVGLWYAAIGHFHEWFFYNFTVNFGREATDYGGMNVLQRIVQFTFCMLPLAALAGMYAVNHYVRGRSKQDWNGRNWIHVFAIVWLGCAFMGGLALRQPYSHYFYGMLAPLAVYAGAALQRPDSHQLGASGVLLAIGLFAFTCAAYTLGIRHEINKNGSPFLTYKVADLIRSESPHSLYVFNHFGILYYLANIPLPDRYTMPGHLTRDLEAHSFQFDGHAEVARILESTPDVIVLTRPFNHTIAPDRIQLLEERLKDGYCTRAIYKAGAHMAYVYQHVGDGMAGAPDVPCTEE